VWERANGPEFIAFGIENADLYRPLARTEQGFWATRFDFFYECEVPLEEMREAAAAVGFRFLDCLLSAGELHDGSLPTFASHEAWLRATVAGIDRESGGPAEPAAAPGPAGD
jgi:hypothetical protein